MEKKRLFSLKEVAEMMGVHFWQIQYLLRSGAVREPGRLSGRRVFSGQDIAQIRELLAKKSKANKAKEDAGK